LATRDTQSIDGGRDAFILDVGAVERKIGKWRRFRKLQAGWRQRRQGVHDHAIVRVLAQAAADANNVQRFVGHGYPRFINKSRDKVAYPAMSPSTRDRQNRFAHGAAG
jgi:hypothetical protein